jgi:hypothetical protein
MALPLIPLLIGAGALLYFMKGSGTSSSPKSKSAATGAPATAVIPTSAPPGASLEPGTGRYDPGLPLVLEQTVAAMLATDNIPQDLVDMGSALLPQFPIASGQLFTKAKSLTRAPPPPAVPLPNPAPAPPAVAPIAPPPAPQTDASGTVTLPPITIVGDPSALSILAWDPSWSIPALPRIPASFGGAQDETRSIQSALNAWGIAASALAVPNLPLTVDGRYGPATQRVAAAFQVWANAAKNAGLAVDGLAGPDTQNYLLDFLPVGPDGLQQFAQGAY